MCNFAAREDDFLAVNNWLQYGCATLLGPAKEVLAKQAMAIAEA